MSTADRVSEITTRRNENYERLVNAMPAIAEAVNAFSSPDVQRRAFEALLTALAPTIGSSAASTEEAEGDENGGDERQDKRGPRQRRRTRKATTRQEVTAARDLDFFPSGKASLRDFAKEKDPKTVDQRNLVAVYYLEQNLGIAEIGPAHVIAAYKTCNWREPSDAPKQLRNTASKLNWIDTSNSKAIKTTPTGRNTVQRDMPIAKEPAKP
jgi:hypothetical protein